MELERVAAVIRPRSYREAIDLGFHMVRTWCKPIYGAFWAVLLPVAVAVAVALPRHPFVALVVIWWLKPWYDRVSLFVLSRALFGAIPDVRETLRKLPRNLRNGIITSVTIYRLDPLRSLRLAVWQLEGLSGSARRQRLAVLTRRCSDQAGWLTLLCICFELSVVISLISFVAMMVPGPAVNTWIEDFFSGEASSVPLAARWVLVFACVAAIGIVEPLYVAAGFSLYLNRRTLLEAWDIEVAFRRMTRRLTTAAVVVGMAAAMSILVPGFAIAQASRTEEPDPGTAIQTILEDPIFGGWQVETRWRLKPRSETLLEPDGALALGALAGLVETLLWVAVVACALGLVYLLVTHAERGAGRRLPAAGPATTILGHEIDGDSLPEDVAAAAATLWRDGRVREALGLLYRGALSHLVDHDGLELRTSATEDECVRVVSRLVASERSCYFRSLTGTWQLAAYGHRPPPAESVETLIRDWPAHFQAVQ